MLPIERRKKIKEWIQINRSMKISELSKKLGVSEMTIHRDIKPLIQEGFIVKTYGGISFAQTEQKHTRINECAYCSRLINERFSFHLLLANKKTVKCCCAHCGLLWYRQNKNDVIQALCYDFLQQTTICASLASYVMDSSLQLGCCQGQPLPFERREHAEKFVKGFGGKVYTFRESMERIFQVMDVLHTACTVHS